MAREMNQAASDKVGLGEGGGGHLVQPEPLSNLDISVYSAFYLT
jgi:hypothetical protein